MLICRRYKTSHQVNDSKSPPSEENSTTAADIIEPFPNAMESKNSIEKSITNDISLPDEEEMSRESSPRLSVPEHLPPALFEHSQLPVADKVSKYLGDLSQENDFEYGTEVGFGLLAYLKCHDRAVRRHTRGSGRASGSSSSSVSATASSFQGTGGTSMSSKRLISEGDGLPGDDGFEDRELKKAKTSRTSRPRFAGRRLRCPFNAWRPEVYSKNKESGSCYGSCMGGPWGGGCTSYQRLK
jgi:hypothetical protein